MIKTVSLPRLGIDDIPFFVEKKVIETGFFEHCHDFTEINVIVRGTGMHKVNGKPLPVKLGDVFVLNPKTSHEYSNADNLMIYQVMFDQEFISSHLSVLRKMSGYQALFVVEPSLLGSDHIPLNFSTLSIQDLELVIMDFENMITEFQCREEGFEALLESALVSLIVFLSRQYHKNKENSTKSIHRVACTAAYIEKNFMAPLSLKHLANFAKISICQLIRDFNLVYGVTPLQYILHLRIKHAILLLKDNNLTITEIAYTCCFSDSNYFARIFKQHTGLSPRQYRRKH